MTDGRTASRCRPCHDESRGQACSVQPVAAGEDGDGCDCDDDECRVDPVAPKGAEQESEKHYRQDEIFHAYQPFVA